MWQSCFLWKLRKGTHSHNDFKAPRVLHLRKAHWATSWGRKIGPETVAELQRGVCSMQWNSLSFVTESSCCWVKEAEAFLQWGEAYQKKTWRCVWSCCILYIKLYAVPGIFCLIQRGLKMWLESSRMLYQEYYFSNVTILHYKVLLTWIAYQFS